MKHDTLKLVISGNLVSRLAVDSYMFKFAGTLLSAAHISDAVTPPQFRGKGYMSELTADSLRQLFQRGHAFAMLNPHDLRFVDFYRRFGFATVFFSDLERYTSVHVFPAHDAFSVSEPSFQGFSALEMKLDNIVIHSEESYNAVVDAFSDPRTTVVAVDNALTGETAAMAFAVADRLQLTVKAILSDSDDAVDTALAEVKRRLPELPMTVYARPPRRKISLVPQGMVRIVDALAVLSALAAADHSIEQVIHIHDHCIPDNNAVYILRNGRCEKTDTTIRRVTLDVNIAVLAEILFSSPHIGSVFGLPTSYATMQLMPES